MEIDPAQFADRLVSGISDAVVYADAEGVIRRWNRGASRIFGFAEAEAIGRSLDIIIAAGLRERHWQAFAPRCAPGGRATGMDRFCRFRRCARMAHRSPSSLSSCRLPTIPAE